VQNPRKNVPRAIKKVAVRIAVFYILAVLMVGFVVPYNHIMLLSGRSDASASPYVIAIQSAGIKILPDFVNAVLLTVTWSAGQSDLYAASRTLYGLALEGQAPRFLKKCTKSGVPIWTVAVTSLYAPLAYMGVGSLGAAKAFLYLYDMSAVSVIIVWWAILIAYIRFYHGLKKQGISRDTLPYKAPFQPYASYFALVFFTLVIIFSGFTVFIKGHWAIDTFLINYATVPIFFFIWLGYKLWSKSKVVALEDIDFVTGQRALDLLDEEEIRVPIKKKVRALLLLVNLFHG
jgi:amino acid transporter